MLKFSSHFVNLVLKLFDFNFFRSDLSVQLFNLIIENEFEFFKFLNLLSQVGDSG